MICTLFVGHKMGYWDEIKSHLLFQAVVMTAFAAVILLIAILLLREGRKICLTRRLNTISNIVLALLFLTIWFLNNWISKEIATMLPADISVVQGTAYQVAEGTDLGYQFYYSIYPNNIPIAWILGKLYAFARINFGEHYNVPELFWFQVECVLFSATGFFICLSVKKLTKNIMATGIAFVISFFLVCLSPWKTAPYTDGFGILFPVLAIYCYLSYKEAKSDVGRLISIGCAILFAMIGGFIKPNIYLVVMAIVAVELIDTIKKKKTLCYVVAEIVMVAVLGFGAVKARDAILGDMGLEFNKEMSASWQHYFCMGLNEDTTGGWNGDDSSIFAIEQYQTKTVRNHYELLKGFERIKERGLWGSLSFYLKKMVMVFDDGTFGWSTEVISIDNYQPIDSHSHWTVLLREYFRPNAGHLIFTNTIMQVIWMFCLMGIPGIIARQKEEHLILAMSFLGVFFYQLLFEARARYLFVFLPLLIVVAVCGMDEYAKGGMRGRLKALWFGKRKEMN